MKEILYELLTDTYKKTVQDNQKDFETIMIVIAKLCSVLKFKGILTEEEIEMIVNIEDRLGGDVDDGK